MVKRLDDLQVLRLQGHDGFATENNDGKCRRASLLETVLEAHEHTVLTKRLQTVAERIPADDALPLRVGYRGLRASGLFEGCARTVQLDVADEVVK